MSCAEGGIKATDDIVALIRAERYRQMTDEGYMPDVDDQYKEGQLAQAAAAYCMSSTKDEDVIDANDLWPWTSNWNPGTQERDLVRAGALIVAELERLRRGRANG